MDPLSDKLRDGFVDALAWTSDSPLALAVARAQGSQIELEDGSTLIDLISGIAVSSIGHRHPLVVQAIRDQLERHLHVMVYGEFDQLPQSNFARSLTRCLPNGLDRVYFTMTGTEANEGALKAAKKFTGRSKMIAFHNSYHGDTHGSLSVTGREIYRKPFEPLLPDVEFLDFGNVEMLDRIDRDTACVITEPIQGEGGVVVPSKEWHAALRERCTEVEALLIFDEIQTGFGRTGKLFGFENFEVVPDIITLAKAMGGGMPLGAFVSSDQVMAVLRRDPPLNHVTTFGGHPLSCAAAEAALQVLVRENLSARAQDVGKRIKSHLVGNGIVEVRGLGAMLGLQMQTAELAKSVVERSLAHGVLVGWTLHSNSLIRIAPPLNIPFDILDKSLHIIAEAVRFSASHPPK